MNHTRQNINNGREHRPRTIEKPWLNNEGYFDPTAYLAVRNVERETETRKRMGASTGVNKKIEYGSGIYGSLPFLSGS